MINSYTLIYIYIHFQPLNNYIDNKYNSLLHWYNTSVHSALIVGNFWQGNQSYLEEEAKRSILWRKPLPNLQTQDVTRFN